MRTGKRSFDTKVSHVRKMAMADQPRGTPGRGRAHLMATSALAGGTLRGLVVAAGMVTVFSTPASAGCSSFNFSFPGVNIPIGVLVD